MAHPPVPVTLGSPEFRHVSVKGCGVVHAWFPPDSTIEPHSHEHATFAVMLNGSFDLAFQRKTFSCTPSSIAVEPAGESHANYIGNRGAEVLVLQPVPDETELWRPFAPLFDSISYLRHGGITGLATRLAGEIRYPDALSPLAMESLLLDMLVSASRMALNTRCKALPPWLGRIQEMLHEEPAASLSVTVLARSAGVHPAYLSRTFRRYFHCSLGEYARRLRLERTAERLIKGDQSIAALAMNAGFADQSHFTRCFKRFYHTTPRSFREAHRQRSGTTRP
jgi:AraC family transcriptional regulator